MKKPNFIIPGAGRSGTTSVFYCLSQHPQVYTPRVKEINYFTKYYHKPIEWYFRHFNGWQGEPAVGEASTLYMYHPMAAKRLFEYRSDLKLIFCLRNPIDRIYSNYKKTVAGQGEARPFLKIINEEPYRFFEASRYSTHLKRFLKYFSYDQMLFIFFEDLIENPNKQLERICTFLNISQNFDFTLPSKKKNASISPHSLMLQKIIKHKFASDFDDVPVKRYIKGALRRTLTALNFLGTKDKHDKLSPEVRYYYTKYLKMKSKNWKIYWISI